jgi:predicted ATPase
LKLRSARITNFRSVEDSTEFAVDDITCLVGKNEAGKTSILQGLYKLNPVDGKARFDRDTEYPRRHLSEYDERHSDGPAVVVDSMWELEHRDRETLSSLLGESSVQRTEFRVTRGYDDSEGQQRQAWSPDVDEARALAHVLAQAALTEEEQAALASKGKPASIKELKDILGRVPEPGPGLRRLSDHLNEHFARGSATMAFIDALEMPEFVYYSQYDRMPGQASLDAIAQRKKQNALTKEDDIVLSFLALAGLTLDDIRTANSTEILIAKLEAVSNRISKTIFKYWSQNRHLKVIVRVDPGLPNDPAPFNTGRVLRTRIWNEHHQVSVPFDERSTGFVWFFSFLVYFSNIESKHSQNLVLLLDEPGLSLHARAQADLLRYFRERLLPKQVIYTTHSPFMVPPESLLSVRTVEDVVRERRDEDGDVVEVDVQGTKVSSDVLSQDRDTLFPLQGALGYELTQGLFVGKHSLVVEGPGDLLYLTAMSARLTALKRTGLDRRWTITPARGLDRIATFVALLAAQKLTIAVLTDIGPKQRKSLDELRKRNDDLLRLGRIFTADRYAEQSEADIEDIFGAPAFVHLVNAAYGLAGTKMVAVGGAGRVLDHVEAAFRTLPADTPEFDHYTPAEFLARNPAALDAALALDVALDRFEKLFIDLNAVLKAR